MHNESRSTAPAGLLAQILSPWPWDEAGNAGFPIWQAPVLALFAKGSDDAYPTVNRGEAPADTMRRVPNPASCCHKACHAPCRACNRLEIAGLKIALY